MPTGYKYSTKQGRWNKVTNRQGFDYETINAETTQFLVSFFRAFPDRLLDIIESPNADFTLALPQRVVYRSMWHYTKSDTTSSRGLGKTYLEVLQAMEKGVLYPGIVIKQDAPSQKMGAELAAKAFHQIERNYPPLAALWKIKSETKDSFKIVTEFGSEYSIGVIQGGNCHELVAEEIGQETEPKFDFHNFESKVLPTCRLKRTINKQKDRTCSKHYVYITNGSRRQNPAYSKYRHSALKAMIKGQRGAGWAIDISWEMTVLFGIRDKEYVEELKNSMTREEFLRQMSAMYTGASENPMVSDEDLSSSRTLLRMESKHCGDPNVIYIVGHDVSYESGTRNAKCADVVMKLTPYKQGDKTFTKRDKYIKDIVWVDSYPPVKDPTQSALHLKELWRRYCMDGGQTTYLAIDSWQYGNAIMRELIKPIGDGINLCCYKHLECQELEGEHALPVIYPIKAGGTGVRDNDLSMINYMRTEYEQGNIRHLTADVNEGLEQYKLYHHIKDNFADGQILKPYYKTNELCEQIQNLQVVPTGASWKEKRVSMSIQRDDWSALKYCGRMAGILEEELARSRNKPESGWQKAIEQFANGQASVNIPQQQGTRARLIGLRRR